jgi:division protein CdvB (Snf7/Vps24/ESCRT-III family)
MTFTATALLYALVGLAVAVALLLRERRAPLLRRALLVLLAVPFWPLLAPFLLGAPAAAPPDGPRAGEDARIRKVQDEVLRALSHLDGLAEEVLAPEVARVRDLTSAMAAMSRRIAEMDALLASPELAQQPAEALLRELAARGVSEGDGRSQSVRARLRNIERLKGLRERTRADLERIVLKLEEMASQLHVLKFAGRPDAELLRAVKEIADGVESIADGLLADEQASAAAAAASIA